MIVLGLLGIMAALDALGWFPGTYAVKVGIYAAIMFIGAIIAAIAAIVSFTNGQTLLGTMWTILGVVAIAGGALAIASGTAGTASAISGKATAIVGATTLIMGLIQMAFQGFGGDTMSKQKQDEMNKEPNEKYDAWLESYKASHNGAEPSIEEKNNKMQELSKAAEG